jgi:hypothetical protein
MTKLAYNINLQFYGDLHYMWCTPYFGSDYNSPTFMVPASSSPLEIYNTLKKEIQSRDLHGTLIKAKRTGIRRGIDYMERIGRITSVEAQKVRAVCKIAPREDFWPLLCIIPRIDAIPYNQTIDVKSKAHPLSQEYVVADVPTSAFDVINLG